MARWLMKERIRQAFRFSKVAQPSQLRNHPASRRLRNAAIRERALRFECAPTRDSRRGLRIHLRHWRETKSSHQNAEVRQRASDPVSRRRDLSDATGCEEYPRDLRLPAPDLSSHV